MNKFNMVLAQTTTATKTAPSVKSCINFIKQTPETHSWIHAYNAAIAAFGEKLC